MYIISSYVIGPQNYDALTSQQYPLQYSLEQLKIQELLSENQNLRNQLEENQCLLSKSEEDRQRLARENQQLRRSPEASPNQRKRRYRKRRINLAKHLQCGYQGCPARFSSQMAFRNHQRKSHGVKKRFTPSSV